MNANESNAPNVPNVPNVPNECVLVIFGASGDLAHRKLFPALYNLAESGHLPTSFAVLGIARQAASDDQFREEMRVQVEKEEGEPLEDEQWRRLAARVHYITGELEDEGLYSRIKKALEQIECDYHVPPNYLFYFAVPPDLFATVAERLAHAGLTKEQGGWRRIIIEKPFGYDLASARTLNAKLTAFLDESQIYRIDHYLGKETVQNILAFRFANSIFEPIWNRRYVDHVQMTVAEDGGIGTRGGYYDKAGALRDIVQNHMFQLLALVGMEPPISFRASEVQDEKVKVLHAIQPLSDADIKRNIVRGQYAGYRQEAKVSPESRTETFVALRLFVDNWRWAGVPFYLRTGKRLSTRVTTVAVQFKRAPLTLFRNMPIDTLDSNVLRLRIQPNEGISLSFNAKVPGPFSKLGTVRMDFGYEEYFHAEPVTGYETLLFDAMAGDHTLFHRVDIVEAGWQVLDPLLKAWEHDAAPPLPYAAGSWGPSEADLLVEYQRPPMARITVVESDALADTAAERLTQLVEQAIASRNVATMSLTGGNTPEETYAALADPSRPYRGRIDWSRLQLFWGDERHVPPDHPDSNFGMANRALVQHIPISPDHVHRIRAERPDPHDAAAEYARELPDVIDVMLLGLGDDCHVASIFPGSQLLDDSGARRVSLANAGLTRPAPPAAVVAVFASHLNAWRITVTPRVILGSRTIVLLVSGAKKAAAVAAAIAAPLDVPRNPGQLLREAGDRVEWILDRSAAGGLQG